MIQAIFLASLAGFAAALLSGMLTPGAMSFAFLFLLSPVPLFIAGFGWHPLVAALAGLIGAMLIDLSTGDRGAIAFASLIALPAFAVSSAAARAFATETRQVAKDGIATGQIGLSVVLYMAFVLVASAIWIEADYALFTQKLRGLLLEGLRQMGAPGNPGLRDPAMLNQLAELMSAILLPFSGLILIASALLSAAIGAIAAERSGRLAYVKPAFPAFRLPGGALLLFAAALLIGLWDGYTGVFAEIVALGLALLLILQGLAVLHVRLIGNPSRGFLLAAAWASPLVFSFMALLVPAWASALVSGLPALLFVGVGIADHLLDLRNRKGAGG